MKKLLFPAVVSLCLFSCNNNGSSNSTDTDSANKKTAVTAKVVPTELIVTPEQVNEMLGRYNSTNSTKGNTLILTAQVGFIRTVIDGLADTENLELIFGSYSVEDFRRREPVYPKTPEDEVVDHACIIFRNPTTRQNYDITVKLCPPPTGPCDVSFYKELKDSSGKTSKVTDDPIKVPENLQPMAADVNAMLTNYLSEDVNRTNSNILTVNIGWLQTVLDGLGDDVDLQLVFGAYTPADFARRQPTFPSTGKGDVINSPCIVFRNDAAKMNYDITVKLCPPPTGACNVSFYQDLKKPEAKK